LITLGSLITALTLIAVLQANKKIKSWYWSGSNWVLFFGHFFHLLTCLWRVLLFLNYGHPFLNNTVGNYITIKSSAAGDLGNTVTCISVYLIYQTNKYKSFKDEKKEIGNEWICKLSYLTWMWIGCIAYSTLWGIGLFRAYDDFNLTFLDEVVSFFIGISAIFIGYLAWNTYNAIKDTLRSDF